MATSVYFLFAFASIFLGVFYLLKKLISSNMPTMLGVVFIYLGGFLFSLFVLLISKTELNLDFRIIKKGIALALLGGIFVASFDVLNLMIFKKGVGVSLATPMLNAGAILIAAIGGILFLRESISVPQLIGVLLALGGIFLISR